MGDIGEAFGKVIKPINKGLSSVFGDELGGALTQAAVIAGTIYAGGALAGTMGWGAAGTAGQAAAAAGSSAANAGGMAALGSTGGTVAVASGAASGYQAGAATEKEEKQAAAAEEAKRKVAEEQRQAEITRKRAMLAEQTSVAARSNAARNVRNTLQGLASSRLGSDNDKLGG